MAIDSMSTCVAGIQSWTESGGPKLVPVPVHHDSHAAWPIPEAIHCVRGLSHYRSQSLLDSRKSALEIRQAENDCSRRCAAQALRLAGMKIPQLSFSHSERTNLAGAARHNPDCSTTWPAGFVGALSHSERWVWAAVARQQEFLSIGLDTNTIVRDNPADSILDEVGAVAEWCQLLAVGLPKNQAVALLTSAKATFYRYWYPLLQRCWDFSDVELVSIDPRSIRNTPSHRNHSSGTMQLQLKSTITPGLAIPEYLCPTAPLTVHFQIEKPDVFTMAWQINPIVRP